MKKIRIGSGAGFAGDRLEPALEVMENGKLDYIIFECLAERTIAIAQEQKSAQDNKGYNSLLEYRMEKVLPLACSKKIKVITNMGAANPMAAVEKVANIAKINGLNHIKIAAVLGDDVKNKIESFKKATVWETGDVLENLNGEIVSANVYMGAEPIVEALKNDADVVITGRVADPALFIAPMIYEFNWAMDDWEKLGKGTLVGHLLECGAQVCGGYYADPGVKEVPELDRLGFPLVEVAEDGDFVLTKTENSGGCINRSTCIEQLLYEIHNPKEYFTPNVVADFSNVQFVQIGKDRVYVKGATGHPRTDTLKASIGYRDCYIGEGEISYGGTGSYQRARLAADVVLKRLKREDICIRELKVDYIGINSMYWNSKKNYTVPDEVRLRICGRTENEWEAERIGQEVEALYTNGPAGGGGVRKRTYRSLSIASILIDRTAVHWQVVYKGGLLNEA